MKAFFSVLVSLFILSGCAPRKQVVIVKEGQTGPTVKEEAPFDTTSKDTTSYFNFIPDTTAKNAKAPEITSPTQTEDTNKVHGFRVQIFAFSSKDRAEKAKKEAEGVLSLPVYIEYDPSIDGPYKVRVGDFSSKEEAEKYKEKLRQEGYPDAFVVETKINK